MYPNMPLAFRGSVERGNSWTKDFGAYHIFVGMMSAGNASGRKRRRD